MSLFICYGILAGWFMARYLAGLIPGNLLIWQAVICGVIIGSLICLLPTALFGASGKLGPSHVGDGIKTGLVYALSIGAIMGAATGVLSAWIGAGVIFLGGWTGAVCGTALGTLFWVKVRR
jgi:hypothetical protein